ncbi:MAG: MMPL family transporter, partial [Chloroflexota bacterium]|nr:MMPL family transporter [Chloroflexota bacterium]
MRHASFFSTEGLARASSRRPWLTIGVWGLVLLAAGALVVSLLQGALTTSQDFVNEPESKRADRLIEERLRGPVRSREIVIVRSDTLTVDDPAFRERVQRLHSDLSALGADVVEAGPTYYQAPDSSLVSADRRETIFALLMAGSLDDASKNIGQVHEVVDRADGQGFRVLITGNASIGKDFQEVAEKDLRNAEVFGVPVALVILVFVFGAIAAAVLPMVLAAVSIVAAMGAAALLGQAFSLSFFVTNMITMMGLAVGIDYSLFVVSRYREERARGLEKLDAIARAGATA